MQTSDAEYVANLVNVNITVHGYAIPAHRHFLSDILGYDRLKFS